MPARLIDTNVWLAISFQAHPSHALARQAFQNSPNSDHWLWCRATQQSYLRLMATPALHRAYGSPPLSNRDARASLDVLLAHTRILVADEPAGVSELWLQLADHPRPAPKLWMNAYLAAVAIQGGWELLSLDRDFESFCRVGLKLIALG